MSSLGYSSSQTKRNSLRTRQYPRWHFLISFAIFAPILLSGRAKSIGFQTFFGIDVTLLATIIICLSAFVYFLLQKGYLPIRQLSYLLPIFLTMLLSFISGSQDQLAQRKAFLIFFLAAPLIISVSFLLKSPSFREYWSHTWIWTGNLISVWTVLGGPKSIIEGRYGLGAETISSAYLSSTAAALCVSRLISRGKNFIEISSLLINVASVLLVGSRGPLLALLVSVVWIQASTSIFWIKKLVVPTFIVLFSLAFWEFLPRTSSTRLTSFLIQDFSRMTLIQLGIENWKENPLFGIGLGQFYWISPLAKYPHNLLIEVLVELGILGIVSLTILFARIFFLIIKSRNNKENQAFVVVALTNIVSQLFSNDLTNRYFWISTVPILFFNSNFVTQKKSIMRTSKEV